MVYSQAQKLVVVALFIRHFLIYMCKLYIYIYEYISYFVYFQLIIATILSFNNAIASVCFLLSCSMVLFLYVINQIVW